MKTCNSIYACTYKTGGGTSTFIGCSYHDYCDYQCPRDSRLQPDKSDKFQSNTSGKCCCTGINTITGGLCPFCGLPIG